MILTIKDPQVFDALVSGRKKYEGRRWKEEYSELSEGGLIIFVLEGSNELLLTRVKDIKKYETIEEMVKELWRDLLPDAENPESALKYYRFFYSSSDPAVAIEVEPLQKETLDRRTLTKWLGISLPEKLRVAVGVDSSGDLFLGHFGDSPIFKIYECNWEGCSLVEERENTTEIEEDEEHEEHHGNPLKFRAILELLKDTDVWCAFRMGPNYVRIVRESDKIPFLTGTRRLDESLEKVRRKFLELALRRMCRWK